MLKYFWIFLNYLYILVKLKENWVVRWFYSINHKDIGSLYGIVGSIFSLIIRYLRSCSFKESSKKVCNSFLMIVTPNEVLGSFYYPSFPMIYFIGATTVAIAAVAGTVAAYAVPIGGGEDPEDPNRRVWVLIKKLLIGLTVSVAVVGICYGLQIDSQASETPEVQDPQDPVEASEAGESESEYNSDKSDDSDAGKCVGEAPTAESAYSLGTGKFSEDRLLQKLHDSKDLLPDGKVDHGEDAQYELDTLFEELKSEGLKELEGNMGQFMVTKELKVAFLKGYVEGTNEVIEKLGFPPYGTK